MADFDADYSAGVTVDEWTDPASGGTPTRINPFPEHPHLRHVGTAGVQIEVTATVGGVVAPVDGALGGRLFTLYHAELPGIFPPTISSPAGQSSVQRFTPPVAGHYSFKLKRPGGGAVFFHLDAQ